MISNFLEEYIKYEINGNILRFKPLNIDSMFKLLIEHREFILFLFNGVKTKDGKIIDDIKEYKTLIFNKYPLVIKSVVALSYVQDKNEDLTFEEIVEAFNNISIVDQMCIFETISEKTFKNGIFKDVEKLKAAIEKVSKAYNLKA